MSKWSLFFLLVPVFGVAVFAVADQHGWSLPDNVSTIGPQIDHLYYVILWITGVVFIGTQAALIYILYRFSGSRKRAQKAAYTHGHRKVEIIWTVIPAAILTFIALYQMPAWIEFRFPQSKPGIPTDARVLARQFEWRIIYPGPDGKMDTVDDVHVPNELHVAMNRQVLIQLRSMDVLHSFFLPHLRVKQDAVPGSNIPIWFQVTKSTRQFQSERVRFDEKEFEDVGQLAVKLLEGKSPLDQYVFEQLAESTRKRIETYKAQFDQGFGPDRVLSKALINDLNAIVEGESIYAAERIANVELSESTREHLELLPGGIYVSLLNRQILQDAYPHEIKKREHHYDLVCAELCGWGHYKMKGRLVVHETQEDLERWLTKRYAEQEASR